VPASRIENDEGGTSENEERWTYRRVPVGEIGDKEDRRERRKERKTMRQSGRE